MKIVVLDGFTLNPGDLDWNELRPLGPCEIHERTPASEVVSRARAADILVTNKAELNRETLQTLPALKYIGVTATGTNVVDLATARSRGIPVTNVPAYGTRSVAQTTMALLLELTQRIGHHAQTVRDGRWSQCPDWCYWDGPLIELDGLTLGIVGLGRIGRAVAALATAFGMKVIACTPTPDSVPPSVRLVDLETLLRQSDVVSLHCPLTPQTMKLLDAQRLSWMRSGALLLNTSRGGLVDEPALADALNSGQLAGAGLDVLSVEPPPLQHPLLQAKNCIISPHLAWATRAARARLLHESVENIRAFLRGERRNVVN
ncbi:Glycerate dehydrogenase [Verrucomicrobia bacterium]|nr:Glycerate dehydrogenase [Verrucomicrobiota bacterium]